MLFRCRNCGGNTVYNPAKKTMCCPHCEGLDSEERVPSPEMGTCVNCGAPIEIKEHTSATKCPNCGTYVILEERVEGNYTPNLIIPFKVSKDKAEEALKNEFSKRVFTPAGFLSSASLDKMEGVYVPFFMYNYTSDVHFKAEGTKVRTWSDSQYRYTETSYYDVVRDFDANFDKVPVDASDYMADNVMDLMEPFNYKELEGFQPKFMSGFFGEKYNRSADELAPRAKEKVERDSDTLLTNTLTGYNSFIGEQKTIATNRKGNIYALLPVWEYIFSYGGQEFKFHVNGQTGKVLGKTPVSKCKVVLFGATWFGLVTLAGMMIKLALSVM